LYEFDFSYLPKKSFVVKPNHGSKGQGIYIVKYLPEEVSVECVTQEEKQTTHTVIKKLQDF